MHGVVPHLTLILMVTPEVGMERIMANSLREVNRLDKEKVEMHQKVYQAYRYIIDNDKTERIVEIDASGDVDTVFNHVYNVVKQKINQLYGK
jgi:dTMP kinase